MRREQRGSKLSAVAVAVLLAVAKAAAEQNGAQTPASPRVVVSIPDCKLALIDNGKVVKIYDVAVGAAVSPSPTGTFEVITRLSNPTYYHPGKVIGPGKANPLGTRWIGLSVKGFGIHGTNVPKSIGKAASHGCIRLKNADVEDLFKRVKVGDVVELHGDRDELVAKLFAQPPVATLTASATVPAGAGVQGTL